MEKQTFDEALARLEAVVRKLEDGQLPLEEALALFEEGISLSRVCHQRLADAEQRISILTTGENGDLILQGLDDRLTDLLEKS